MPEVKIKSLQASNVVSIKREDTLPSSKQSFAKVQEHKVQIGSAHSLNDEQ